MLDQLLWIRLQGDSKDDGVRWWPDIFKSNTDKPGQWQFSTENAYAFSLDLLRETALRR